MPTTEEEIELLGTAVGQWVVATSSSTISGTDFKGISELDWNLIPGQSFQIITENDTQTTFTITDRDLSFKTQISWPNPLFRYETFNDHVDD